MTNCDKKTADAFSKSWNNLPSGSVYTKEQFEDWMEPLSKTYVHKKRVLELGCGNGSLLVHMVEWEPDYLEGVDLGSSVKSAKKNLSAQEFKNWKVTQDDLVTFQGNGFDIVYCIGVLHHLKEPKKGLDSVIRNTRKGGRFHCWVYAKEGNLIIRLFVEPLRKIFSHAPWWFTKYLIATPLVIPYFLYAKCIRLFKNVPIVKRLPLYEYSLWISIREFSFFRHVAFDQLVTPQTTFIDKTTVEGWVRSYPQIEQESCYIIFRNGNSWKFGGRII